MVAFKNPIVRFLVIPSGATTGERVVIDGQNGLITVYGPNSTGPNNGIVAQIGEGVGFKLLAGNIEMDILQNAGPGADFPGFRWTDTDDGKFAYMNIVPEADPDGSGGVPVPGLNTGVYQFTDLNGGIHTVRNRLFLALSNMDISIQGDGADAGKFFGGGLELSGDASRLGHYATAGSAGFVTDIQAQDGAVFIDIDFANVLELKVARGSDAAQRPVITRVQDVWLDLPLLNGWTPAVSSGFHSGIRIRKDAAGIAYIQGVVNAPASPVTVICDLPTGFGPTSDLLIPVFYSANTPRLGMLQITPNTIQFNSNLGIGASGQMIISYQWPAEF